VTLVIGGGRSGKSSWAEHYAQSLPSPRAYLATAEGFDDEMKARIAAHQERRVGAFTTIEEAIEIGQAIANLSGEYSVCLIDCLTVWLGNLLYHEKDLKKYLTDFYDVLANPPCELVIVTNETGLGIIPGDQMSRVFRDEAGWMNQRVAQLADRVILLVAGIPLAIKGELP